MSPRDHSDNDLTALDELIEKITVDAYGDDERFWAFRRSRAGRCMREGSDTRIMSPIQVCSGGLP